MKFAEINPFSLFTTKSTTPLTGVDKGMQPQAKASIKVIGNPSYIDDKQKAHYITNNLERCVSPLKNRFHYELFSLAHSLSLNQIHYLLLII